jgi:probable rRNA maturation factor
MNADPPKPAVALSDRQSVSVDPKPLLLLAERTLAGEGVHQAELSVSLVTIDEMTDLHQRYMGEEGPTDVLSFPLDEASLRPDEGPRMLGDVVICPEVAAAQNDDVDAELRLLLVHGILHLLGYDHETDEDRTRMWERQEAYSGVRA